MVVAKKKKKKSSMLGYKLETKQAFATRMLVFPKQSSKMRIKTGGWNPSHRENINISYERQREAQGERCG